jgi:hypothetical protein
MDCDIIDKDFPTECHVEYFRYYFLEDRKVKQVLSGGWHQWERGEHKEKV